MAETLWPILMPAELKYSKGISVLQASNQSAMKLCITTHDNVVTLQSKCISMAASVLPSNISAVEPANKPTSVGKPSSLIHHKGQFLSIAQSIFKAHCY